MKTLLPALFVLLAGINAQASNVDYSCSNAGNTVQIDLTQVSILIGRNPDQHITLSRSAVNLAEEELQKMPAERRGCTSRTVMFRRISITQKDGSPMPDAYNRLAKEGALEDYFLCAMRASWIPPRGMSCE